MRNVDGTPQVNVQVVGESEYGSELAELLTSLGLSGAPKRQHSEEPDHDRYEHGLFLLQSLDRRMQDVDDSHKEGTLEPRIVVTDHDDIRQLLFALDDYGQKSTKEIVGQIRAYAMGDEEFTREECDQMVDTLVSIRSLMAGVDRLHKQWHEEHSADEMSQTFSDPAGQSTPLSEDEQRMRGDYGGYM